MRQCHEFVVNHVVWHISGTNTWEEALGHLWGQGHVHHEDVRRLLELRNADAVPQWQVEDVLRATQGVPSGLSVRHHNLRDVPHVAPPPPPPSAPPCSIVVDTRHELRLSSRLIQRLRALVPNHPRTTSNLHMEEAIQIRSVDRRLNNESLILQVYSLLLKHQGPRLVSKTSPPAKITLRVVLFFDGYDPRSRKYYNVKVAILDLQGHLFDPVEALPSATSLLTWRELSRADWARGAVNGRVQEIEKLQGRTFRLPVVVAGTRHVVELRLQLRLLMADHHQTWSELQNGQGYCSCQWDRKNHLANLFTTKPLHLDSFSVSLVGLSNVAQVKAVQLVLHNIKGFGSRQVVVVGHTLPTAELCAFPLLVVVVARLYELKIDPHTKQCQTKTRSRFLSRLSHTASGAHTVSNGCASWQIALPPPSVVSELLSYCIPLVWDQAHATICMVHTG